MEDKQRIVSISADLYDKLSKRIETQDKIILMLNMKFLSVFALIGVQLAICEN